jgi:hypothetical protein
MRIDGQYGEVIVRVLNPSPLIAAIVRSLPITRGAHVEDSRCNRCMMVSADSAHISAKAT